MPEQEHEAFSIHAVALMPLICERLAAGQTVRGLTFQGVSMLPMLRQGRDNVELTRLPAKLKKYDLPVYRGVDGTYVMHRVVDVQEDCYICLGDNTYRYERVSPERMVALVCAFTRNGRRVSVKHRGYQLYCRVWVAAYPVRRFLKRVQWWIAHRVKHMMKR